MSPEGLSGSCLVEDAGAGFPCCPWQGIFLLAFHGGQDSSHLPWASCLRTSSSLGRSGNSEDGIARTIHRLDSETEGQVRT